MLYRQDSANQRRRGVVLLAVLVVIVLLTLAATQFDRSMVAEYKAAMSYKRAAQGRALADSGVAYAALALSDRDAFVNLLQYNPYSNQSAFQRPVGKPLPGVGQGYFTVISPLGPDENPSDAFSFRYGVSDEAGKINLNGLLKIDSSGQAGVQILMKLGAPEEVANAIMDWLDPDDTPRPGGAESEAYAGMGYRAKNGPLDTLDELLFVQGVTPELLYGNDRNRNGILDPDEAGSGGELNLGLAAYLTVYSREQNVDSEGKARAFVNDTNKIDLYAKLKDAVGADLAAYIILYRTYGPAAAASTATTQPAGGNQGGGQIAPQPAPEVQGSLADLNDKNLPLTIFTPSRRRMASIFELVNTEVLVTSNNPRQPSTRYACPLNSKDTARELLPILFDKLTTNQQTDLAARVNVNTAPRQVLLALPNLTEDDVDKIIASRPSMDELGQPTPELTTPTWLWTRADVSVQTLTRLERFITTRTQVYRMQVMGHYANGGPTARIEAIVDTNRGRPRVVYWRDLSELGRGFDVPAPRDNQIP